MTDAADFPTLAAVKRAHLVRVLVATGGDKKRAAAILAVSRGTLYRWIDREGIHPTEWGGDLAMWRLWTQAERTLVELWCTACGYHLEVKGEVPSACPACQQAVWTSVPPSPRAA
jgi:hypothetical protein